VRWTSISGALAFSGRVLAESPFDSTRRVIDVSGDGPNNNGPPPEPERDRLVDEGVTINGLPIINDRPNFGMVQRGLEAYYRTAVIGGPGSFLILAEDFNAFGTAIRRKLIMEIATRPAHQPTRIQSRNRPGLSPRPSPRVPIQASLRPRSLPVRPS